MQASDMVALASEMKTMTEDLHALPDDQEWTMEQLDALDDLRMAATRLRMSAEAILHGIVGR